MAFSKKFNFAPLRKVMDKIDDNGRHGRCGNWEMGLGGYDMGYEIYYKGTPIGRVDYGDKEYELYDEDFIPKDQIPEFLAAIDARKFKDVGYHEQDDEDDIVGEEVDIGWDLEAMRDDAARRSRERDARDKLDEKKIVFNDREMRKKYAKHLISNAQRDDVISLDKYKELLSAFDQAKPGDRFDIPEMEKYLKGWFVQAYAESRKVNESRKQTMWAVDVRNMHTAIHGLYYGKDKRRVQKFAREMGRLTEIEGEYDPEEIDNVWDDFFAEYPDIQTIEEFNYRDIVDLPGGYEGVEIGDTIYKFVNRTSIDLYYESTRNQKMKFKKIVKEAGKYPMWWIRFNDSRNNLSKAAEDMREAYYECNNGKIKSYADRMSDLWRELMDVKFNESTKIVKEADEGYASDHPRIYVGTYAKYNDGSIDGKWIDISEYNTYEEFVDACRELHADEEDPEFMVQDYENFPEKWYHEGGLPTEEEFNKINDYYMMDDSEKDAYAAYVSHTGNDSIDDFHEAYQGQFDSAEDFAYHIVDSMGWDSLGQENLDMYFDYEAFGRDLMYDFHIGDPDNMDSEGEPEDPDHYYDNDGYDQGEYESNRQVGEDYVDGLGGVDQLGDNAQNYFDYEAFGRDLFINDYFEEDGYVFSRY